MELLKKLTQVNGVSGNESNVREIIENEIRPYVDEIRTDALGNLIAHKKGSGKCLAMFAHMDEIGVIATYIDEKGFIRFSGVGGLNSKNLVNLRVRFQNGTRGVIGAEEKDFYDKHLLSKLYIDIGAKSREEAQERVAIGDTAMFDGEFFEMGNSIVSKALDDRAGCWCLINAAKENSGKNDIYYIFTVQEEVGLRGAKTAALTAEFDSAVAVDVTDTGDTPGAETMAVELGKGAAVKIMDRSVICHPYVRGGLIRLAKENGVPYQLEIMTDGGTDAGAVHTAGEGVKTGGLSIPVRYVHSPSETAHRDDMDAVKRLLVLWQNEE